MPKLVDRQNLSDKEASSQGTSKPHSDVTKSKKRISRKPKQKREQKPKTTKLKANPKTGERKSKLQPKKSVKTIAIPCAQMSKTSIKKLQKLLEPTKLDQSELQLKKCISMMTSTNPPHILFLGVLRKAIIHSLLERRWDNLVEFLMMLVDNFYGWIHTFFIRQVCEIVYHLDPRVAGTELGQQLDLIKKVYTTKKESSNIV